MKYAHLIDDALTRLMNNVLQNDDLALIEYAISKATCSPDWEEAQAILEALSHHRTILLANLAEDKPNALACLAYLACLQNQETELNQLIRSVTIPTTGKKPQLEQLYSSTLRDVLYFLAGQTGVDEIELKLLSRAFALGSPEALARSANDIAFSEPTEEEENDPIETACTLLQSAIDNHKTLPCLSNDLFRNVLNIVYLLLRYDINEYYPYAAGWCDAAIAHFKVLHHTALPHLKRLYEDSDQENYCQALLFRATLHLKQQEHTAAVSLMHIASVFEPAHVMFWTGVLHEEGLLDGEKNYVAAAQSFEQAVQMGHVNSLSHLASIYLLGKHGKPNIPRGILVMERAMRKLEQIDVADEFLQQYESLSPDEGPVLVDLLWPDLLQELDFSDNAIQALQKNKSVLLAKIAQSGLDTSLHFLKRLKTNPAHPITRALTHPNHVSPEFRELMRSLYPLAQIRALLLWQFQQALQMQGADISIAILDTLQPGAPIDRCVEKNARLAKEQVVEKLLARIENAIISSKTSKPWPTDIRAQHKLHFNDRTYWIPRAIFNIYTLLQTDNCSDEHLEKIRGTINTELLRIGKTSDPVFFNTDHYEKTVSFLKTLQEDLKVFCKQKQGQLQEHVMSKKML